MIFLYLEGVLKIREYLDLCDEIDESGIERNKNLDVAKPTILDFKEFNYESCCLIDCIFLVAIRAKFSTCL